MRLDWQRTSDSTKNPELIRSKRYICGYCGETLASGIGYAAKEADMGEISSAKIYICHYCYSSTYFDASGKQTPGSAYGGEVKEIPSEDVRDLYNEARDCIKVNAYTTAVLCCRKLLMNVAVDQGADENKSFAYYVDPRLWLPRRSLGERKRCCEEGRPGLHTRSYHGPYPEVRAATTDAMEADIASDDGRRHLPRDRR